VKHLKIKNKKFEKKYKNCGNKSSSFVRVDYCEVVQCGDEHVVSGTPSNVIMPRYVKSISSSVSTVLMRGILCHLICT
jgi:hypothetical protein